MAARLAEAGFSVLVLEAGGAPQTANYEVPAFHPFATEEESMRWDFFVHHYESRGEGTARSELRRAEQGFWYPRAGTLGGCTAHNAMILAYPHQADWDELADLTGDPSWRAEAMRQYFERLENCHHRPFDRLKRALGLNPSRHGFEGWLHTEKGDPGEAITDDRIRKVIARSVGERPQGVPPAVGVAARESRGPERLARRLGWFRGDAVYAADHEPSPARRDAESGCRRSPIAGRSGCGSS